MKLASLLFLGLVCVGCYKRTDINTRYGESHSDSLITPFTMTADLGDTPKSDWSVCMAKYRDYDGATSICTEMMEASRPGALPLCGTPGAMMNAGMYGGMYGYGYGYGQNYGRVPQGACRQPK